MKEKKNIHSVSDEILLEEVKRRFDQKNTTLQEMEFLTKKLYDLNEKLKEHDSIKGEFLSLIKNVFNNPLSSLLNLSSMMKKNSDSPKTETIKTLLDMELRKLNFHLNNIFTAAEIEAGEIANYWSEIDIKLLVEEICADFDYLLHEKELVFTSDIVLDRLIISDAKKLHLILTNLISNALEYSFCGNEVHFEARIEDEALKLSLSNIGDVIEASCEKELFSRFKKVRGRISKARQSVDGLGLGLSIIASLVESLDGTTACQSSDEKTVFTIVLKLQNDANAQAFMSESSNEFLFDDTQELKEF